MKLKVLGSNSSGNCYILENEKEAIIIEAGVRFSEVQKSLDFDTDKISACFVSHAHSDHSKYVSQFEKHGIPVYRDHIHNLPYKMNDFTIRPLSVKHDVPCFCFAISHPETGTILFATDTYLIPYKLKGISHLIIEANYDENILKENIELGNIHSVYANRVIQSHMSIDTTLKYLKTNLDEGNLFQLRNIILVHLSSKNSNSNDFIRRIQETIAITPIVAKKGIEINFNKEI